MITAAQIASIPREGPDFEDTERLKAKLAEIHRERHPLYLTAAEFEEILKWKLRQQIGRQRHLRAANTEEIIRAVTGLALTIAPADKEYEIELRLNILSALRGVDIPVASAVVALVFPDEYAVIDSRVWQQLFDEKRWVFSVPNYKKYLAKIRTLADELGWPVQEVDHAIWVYTYPSECK
jgi:hypothetical protein